MNLTGKRHIAGVDLGGTWVRAVLSDRQGNFLEKARAKVEKTSEDAISDQIISMVQSLLHRRNLSSRHLEGVGIASAGPLDLKKGRLLKPPNLPFYQVPITKPITERLDVPTYLVNDCTAAVLGEKEFGAGKGLDDVAFVTIGTGIGGGAIVDGHLLWGKDGNAVEVGHFTVDYNERLQCGCGNWGHWEAYCGGKNIPNFVRLRIEDMKETATESSLLRRNTKGDNLRLTSEDLFAAARSGDPLSLRLVDEIGSLNAIGFADVINAYDPSLITVGGSVVLKNKKLVLQAIKEKVGHHAFNRLPRIQATPLGEDVGVYGAVAAVRNLRL